MHAGGVLEVVVVLSLNSVLCSEDLNNLKLQIKSLSDSLEKWNNIFLNTLEPRMIFSATSLASIDTNIKSLLERAHVWDNFQLHISAWNDQLATLDRKSDIISEGQKKLLALDSKINSLSNVDYKLDEALTRIENIENTISKLNEKSHKNRNILLGEFTTRGVLTTVKKLEKKLDRLLSQQSILIKVKDESQKGKLTIKCNTPRFVEEFLKDISSKIDIIFDKVSDKFYDFEDNNDEGSGIDNATPLELRAGNVEIETKGIRNNKVSFEIMYQKILEIENVSFAILADLKKCEKFNIEKLLNNKTCPIDVKQDDFYISDKLDCDELGSSYRSGIYIFGNRSKNNFKNNNYNKRYCTVRENGSWTVIQRRDDYFPHQNFNLSWEHYKNGFGNLDKNFWFGNNFISRLSTEKKLILRIELEDFNGNYVWAEYSKFLVLEEDKNYQLIVGKYRGNASDSFSSHNGSYFSTFDKKNDQAPLCCPCAVSYGGGWWFNSCFESNLNGLYYKKADDNGYFGGIIWEKWLGDYSLKKTLMMVKGSNWDLIEDP